MYQYDDATAVAVRPGASNDGTPGWFTDGDPAAGASATILRAEFMNMLQAELLAILTGAGVTPSKSDSDQVLDALKIMFMKRSSSFLGNGAVVYGATTVLDATHAGKLVIAYGATGNLSFTLPAASAMDPGASISFLNSTNYVLTINAAGADLINPAKVTQASIVLKPGDTFSAVLYGTIWESAGGSAALPYIDGFLSALSANGYQKLPNGLIIQWGTKTSSGTASGNATATLPTTFPNAFLWGGAVVSGVGGLANNTVQVGAGTVSSLPMTTLSNAAITSAMTVFYLAIGY